MSSRDGIPGGRSPPAAINVCSHAPHHTPQKPCPTPSHPSGWLPPTKPPRPVLVRRRRPQNTALLVGVRGMYVVASREGDASRAPRWSMPQRAEVRDRAGICAPYLGSSSCWSTKRWRLEAPSLDLCTDCPARYLLSAEFSRAAPRACGRWSGFKSQLCLVQLWALGELLASLTLGFSSVKWR